MTDESSDERFIELAEQCRVMTQTNIKLVEALKQGQQKLVDNAEVLRKATEDIHLLLAFIRSRNLKPPKIQSNLIN